MTTPRLSICIATFQRARFIGETLDSILGQMEPGIELVVVDGASPDDTETVVAAYVSRHPEMRYFRENQNSGVDGDYDKAVAYARGEYCWLMTDDDVLKPGAISRVLGEIDGRRALIVLNSEVLNADLSILLKDRLLSLEKDKEYRSTDGETLFAETASALSFIGCVVIKRDFWLARERLSYCGSLFVHVGVIFQAAVPAKTLVIAEPLISIRYGNAMWTPRGFEIWMFKWPALIWSFSAFSERSKSRVCAREPWRQFRKLWLYRGIGGYSLLEYRRFFGSNVPLTGRFVPATIAALPCGLINSVASFYCLAFARDARMNIYDLARSVHATWVSRAVARIVGI